MGDRQDDRNRSTLAGGSADAAGPSTGPGPLRHYPYSIAPAMIVHIKPPAIILYFEVDILLADIHSKADGRGIGVF